MSERELAAPPGTAKERRKALLRAKRLKAAEACLTETDARIVVEALAKILMPGASIFWDEAERQVELIGSRFEVIVREPPNAPGSAAGEKEAK